MPGSFRYSRWDGTQKGFELDADSLLAELTDDLLYHGELDAALRRLLQDGVRDADGNRLAGLRELIERLRQRRKEELAKHDLGGVYDDIARALRDVVETERAAIDDLDRQARESGDARRQDITGQAMAERRMELDLLPPDLAGQVKALEAYDFVSPAAAQAFQELMDELRRQLLDSQFQSMAGAMQNTTPEEMARFKDMLSALNSMLDERARGEEPDFEGFMAEYGDMFPENPQTLDELLESMARRMAAMQAFLNSLTPEQRAQLSALSAQLLDDMDLRWQVDRLQQHLQGAFPGEGWGRQFQTRGRDPLGMAGAVDLMERLGNLDQLENLLSSAPSPGALAEVDFDVARDLLGDDGAASLERLAELARILTEAGLIENREGRLELTPRGLRAIGRNALGDLFQGLEKDRVGRHALEREGPGHERSYSTKPYEWGDPFNLDIQRTLRNAVTRGGGGHAGGAGAGGLRGRAHGDADPVEHGPPPRPVAVDAHEGQLPGRQEGGRGPALADLDAVPAGLPGPGRLRRGGPHPAPGGAAPGVVGLQLRHQHPARPAPGPPDAVPPARHPPGPAHHRRRADRPHPPER